MILFVALAALLLAAVAAGATDVFAKKKGSIQVTVTEWQRDTGKVKYSVFKSFAHTDVVLGEKVVNFKGFKLTPSEDTFTTKVSFKVNKLHSGEKIAVCATDVAEFIHGCEYGIKYKPGKTLKAFFAFEIVEDDD